ncbi:solute carrier family 23 protein [Brucella pseudogrignonensis]|nr:solute carrier family 23 protein [Brucella pseudogrignonensis]
MYLVVVAETKGTWFAISAVADKPLTKKQADRGAAGEGLGCLTSVLLCSAPVTK